MHEVAKEYAQALFSLAAEAAAVKEYGQSLTEVRALLEQNPQLNELIRHPGIPLRQRLEALERVLSPLVPPQVCNFFMLLCEKNRLATLPDCLAHYQDLLTQWENALPVAVRSAVELSDEQKRRLQTQLEKQTGRQIRLSYRLDPELIGGVVLEWEGKVLDGSIRQRLRKIKEVITQ